MRIRMTDAYSHDRMYRCDHLDDCEQHYCKKHRLLWSDCDTAEIGLEGDRDIPGGLHEIIELGDCPDCEADSRRKRYARLEQGVHP